MSEVRKELLSAYDRFPVDLAEKIKELCRYSSNLEYKLRTERLRNKELEARIKDLAAIEI